MWLRARRLLPVAVPVLLTATLLALRIAGSRLAGYPAMPVAGLVTQTPGSIGYVELIFALQTKSSYGAVQNASGEFVRASDALHVALRHYAQAEACPRCAADLRAPGLMSSTWDCELHGPVAPLRTYPRLSGELLRLLATLDPHVELHLTGHVGDRGRQPLDQPEIDRRALHVEIDHILGPGRLRLVAAGDHLRVRATHRSGRGGPDAERRLCRRRLRAASGQADAG